MLSGGKFSVLLKRSGFPFFSTRWKRRQEICCFFYVRLGFMGKVPKATHWVIHEQPERVNRLILDFLGEMEAG
jgi:hypothetical protein